MIEIGQWAFLHLSKIQRQHRQPLIDVVVQVAGDPSTIFLLRRQKLPGQCSQLFSILLKLPFPGLQRGFAGAQRLFRFFTVSNLGDQGSVESRQLLCPCVHSRLEFVVRLPEFVLGSAAMQKKQQREPESREAEQTIDYAHPMGYARNGQAEVGTGQVEYGTDRRGNEWTFSIRQ